MYNKVKQMYDCKLQIWWKWTFDSNKTHKGSESEQEKSKKRQHNYSHSETKDPLVMKMTHQKP